MLAPSTLHQLSCYDYPLDDSLIAQKPCSPKDHSRLLVVDKASQRFYEAHFFDLPSLLKPTDHLVFNDTQVIPARLKGRKESGGKVEIFCLAPVEGRVWKVLAKPARKLTKGMKVFFQEELYAEVLQDLEEGEKWLQFSGTEDLYSLLEKIGELPLPHYISRSSPQREDQSHYQTIYAKKKGAVAAPTAGLHFTQNTFDDLKARQIPYSMLTLHVGLGTFRPVKTQDITEHKMHKEYYEIPQDLLQTLKNLQGNQRLIAVGTTSLRALESAFSDEKQEVKSQGETDIFIYPGYSFKKVHGLLTNFHLPQSTLLMLVSALGGYELIMEAYRYAVEKKFRFFSYGDAMLIL